MEKYQDEKNKKNRISRITKYRVEKRRLLRGKKNGKMRGKLQKIGRNKNT